MITFIQMMINFIVVVVVVIIQLRALGDDDMHF